MGHRGDSKSIWEQLERFLSFIVNHIEPKGQKVPSYDFLESRDWLQAFNRISDLLSYIFQPQSTVQRRVIGRRENWPKKPAKTRIGLVFLSWESLQRRCFKTHTKTPRNSGMWRARKSHLLSWHLLSLLVPVILATTWWMINPCRILHTKMSRSRWTQKAAPNKCSQDYCNNETISCPTVLSSYCIFKTYFPKV